MESSDEHPVNGFGTNTRSSERNRTRKMADTSTAVAHVATRELRPRIRSSSSNNYETAEEFLRPRSSVKNVEKPLLVSSRATPSTLTNSVEDSLLRGSLVAEGCGLVDSSVAKRQARKRKRTPESDRETPKKSRSTTSDRDSDDVRKSGRTINGLVVNGASVEFKPMDLVWAKCRGYPSYPALVIDPDISAKGMKVNGEEIQPSDEVLSLREKNTYLIRFFDGRRTWQWLPPDKVEPLGIDAETDSLKLSTAGSSKRGVKEAYQRATRYQKHLKSSSRAKTEASAGNTNTSDSEEEEEEGDSDRT